MTHRPIGRTDYYFVRAWSSADCSDCTYASLVYVAPDTVSIEALCAFMVSEFNAGTARLLICTLLRSPLGETNTVTAVILPPAALISTCTGPYFVSIVDPSNVPLAKAFVAATGVALVDATTATVVVAAVGAAVVGASSADSVEFVIALATGRVAAVVAAILVVTGVATDRAADVVVALAWSA